MCQMSSIDFPIWLQSELNKKGWKPTELAKYSKLSDAAISRILRGERRPDTDTLLSFAKAFKISPSTIFRKAGLLPENDGEDISFEDWQYLLNQLSSYEQEEIRQIIEMKIERRQKAEQTERTRNFKPKKAG